MHLRGGGGGEAWSVHLRERYWLVLTGAWDSRLEPYSHASMNRSFSDCFPHARNLLRESGVKKQTSRWVRF